ncbi:SseB family protein [Saccharopolyspora erythraea]|nr:SseB family protein [Saccharopolyspora erythraea]
MGGRVLTFAGTLPDAEPASSSSEVDGSLVVALGEVRSGLLAMGGIPRVLRESVVFVELTGADAAPQLPLVTAEGSAWAAVFSSLPRMAAFFRSAQRGGDTLRYGRLSGAELLDEVWPQLPAGTGLVLDPGSEHVVAVPPFAGLAPESVVVERALVVPAVGAAEHGGMG